MGASPGSTTQSRSESARRSWLGRLIRAQETGLIFVIALMVAVLTLGGGTKEKPLRIELPSTLASIEELSDGEVVRVTPASPEAAERVLDLVADTLPESSEGNVVVAAPGGGERRFASVATPRVVASGEGDQAGSTLFVRKQVNKFLEFDNIVLLLQSASYVAIMAIGMTAIIVMGGIDLSVGSIYALSGVVTAMVLEHQVGKEASAFIAIPAGVGVACLVGALCGAFNGIMIVGLRVHPFIITLGTMAAYRGLTLVINNSYNGGVSIGPFPASFTSGFMKLEMFGGVYPVPVFIMLLVTLAGMFVLTQTVIGRRAYAIGGNETAAKYAGVPVGLVKIAFFTIVGLLAGLSASVYLGYLGGFASNAGEGYELQVIAATVIGGASLSGGRGSAFGALLGAIIIQLIDNGMIILDIDTTYNRIVMGAAIVAAVLLDQAKGRLGSGARR
ncbi:MAG: ABC transporter permease [Planctomycetota bacterium]|nr:ABC transporter permease [Planctomycetota bacterium]